MTTALAKVAQPDPEIRRFLIQGVATAFLFDHVQYYLPGSPTVSLVALLAMIPGRGATLILTDKVDLVAESLELYPLTAKRLVEFSEELDTPLIALKGCWKLQPVHIPKPWGQEIWYTGIEARGCSKVSDGRRSIPLPWLLSLAPEYFIATGQSQPNLLKILDPLPDDLYGDLYFELHRKKQEVYVVTHIADSAWPSGEGAIRYGFDPKVRSRYADDDHFRQAYLHAVKTYESVRRRVDQRMDEYRLRDKVSLVEPVDSKTLEAWRRQLPKELLAEEESARNAMNAFTFMMPLRVGDVVKVAFNTPHALQHGVRTVEFQTPVYERKILSFAQKVLTQNHWDTEEAVATMNLEPGCVESLPMLQQTEEYLLEQVVMFEDFTVHRLTLEGGGLYQLKAGCYKVLLVVSGRLKIDDITLEKEEAVLIPRISDDTLLEAVAGSNCVCLISQPTLGKM